jgi:hypothetical protein
LLGKVGGSTHLWKAFVHENKNMAFKWYTCVGIQEIWEVQCMLYDPHFLEKGLNRLTAMAAYLQPLFF